VGIDSGQAKRIWQTYAERLATWAESRGVGMPQVREHCHQPYHMFYLLLPSEGQRNAFIAYMAELRISAVFHYLPLHISPMGQHYGGNPGDWPVTEDVAGRLVRLTFYGVLTAEEQDRVIEAVEAFPF
jgi:dTDP-4-amino-4,6-dideoxygalactose transaminase